MKVLYRKTGKPLKLNLCIKMVTKHALPTTALFL